MFSKLQLLLKKKNKTRSTVRVHFYSSIVSTQMLSLDDSISDNQGLVSE